MSTKTRTITLASGKTAKVPAAIENVVGIDSEGRVVVDHFDAFNGADTEIAGHTQPPFVFGLTLCCNASDKGTEDGNVCRACYGTKRNADEGEYHFRHKDGSWPAEVDYLAGSPFASNVAAPVVVPESHPIGFSAALAAYEATTDPTPAPAAVVTEKENRMSTKPAKPAKKSKSTGAAAQFAALGIDESDWTDAMALAVKQRWSNLPVDKKVDDLRADLAAVVEPPLPTDAELVAAGFTTDPAKHDELARRKRNAKVQAWRARKQIQAALDARDLRFRAMRAKRSAAAKAS